MQPNIAAKFCVRQNVFEIVFYVFVFVAAVNDDEVVFLFRVGKKMMRKCNWEGDTFGEI